MKRGQGWGFDLIIAATLFFITVIIFFFYSLNYGGESHEVIDDLFYDGEFVSSTLLSEGFPDNWNSTNVVTIGITNENKINETKLLNLYNMTNTSEGYAKTKSIFNTRYEYFFNLSEPITFGSEAIAGIGNLPNSNVKNSIQITRFTIYKNKPVSLYLQVWE